MVFIEPLLLHPISVIV